jgi:tetratricopeptide (TPR) repeat protein
LAVGISGAATPQAPSVQKLSPKKIEQLIAIGTPDDVIAQEIRVRGLDFSPTQQTLDGLASRGAGAGTLNAVRELVRIGATEVRAPDEVESRDNLQRGITAFKNAKYADAAILFRRALDLSPGSTTARLYLATAYTNQYIPGVDSPGNLALARNAIENFQKVLEADPKNATAIESIASLYYLQSQGTPRIEEKLGHLEDARLWYQRLAEVSPSKKEAFYSLGVIAWAEWYPDWNNARTRAAMKPDTPGPLKDKRVREDLINKHGLSIEAAIRNLQRAIEIDKVYDDAMAYLNLLYRERADLADSPFAYDEDIKRADYWIQKALDIRNARH